MKCLSSTLRWGEHTTTTLVNPESISKKFSDLATLAAELHAVFPASAGIIIGLRQDMKIHQFDLSNTITDVQLMATTTDAGLRRTERKLSLRNKFVR